MRCSKVYLSYDSICEWYFDSLNSFEKEGKWLQRAFINHQEQKPQVISSLKLCILLSLGSIRSKIFRMEGKQGWREERKHVLLKMKWRKTARGIGGRVALESNHVDRKKSLVFKCCKSDSFLSNKQTDRQTDLYTPSLQFLANSSVQICKIIVSLGKKDFSANKPYLISRELSSAIFIANYTGASRLDLRWIIRSDSSLECLLTRFYLVE